MKKNLKKALALCIAVMMLAVLAVGCGSASTEKETETGTYSAQSTQATTAAPTAEPVVPIRWVRAGNEQDPAKDRILLELQKKLNIKLEIVSIPWDQFPNKLNVMMATGEHLDLANCDPGATLNGWAHEGIILAWDDFLKSGKYPLVNAIVNSDIYKTLKIDGKIYYKPLPLVPIVWGNIIRTDWLDNLELKMPTNLDELHNVLKAFVENDPDKNGKKDTYGFYDDMSFNLVMKPFGINLAPNRWILQPDGTIARCEISDANKESLKYLRMLYAEGLIKKDFATTKRDNMAETNYGAFADNKYGIGATTTPQRIVDLLATKNPDAKIDFLPPLQGVNGVPPNSGHDGGFWWGNVIPKTCNNPEKVLEVLEYALTPEGRELTEFGINGIHFTEVKELDGMKIYAINEAECDKDWDTKKNGYLYPLTWGGLNYFEYAYIPIKENNYDFDAAFKNIQQWVPDDVAKGQFPKWQSMVSSYSVPSPLLNVYDDSIVGDSNKLLSIYDEARLKLIMDQKSDFDKVWDDMKQKWLAAGGDAVIKAGNEFYKKLQAQ